MTQIKERIMELTGQVEWLGLPGAGRDNEGKNYHVTQAVESLKVQKGHGVRGDAHAGFRLSDTRERLIKKFGLETGFETANHREYSAISMEGLQQISTAMEFDECLPYGLLGENIVVRGIPDFTMLPSGTLLFFESQKGKKRYAILSVWDVNAPCHIPAAAIEKYADKKPDVRFQVVAKFKRGITGQVYSSGKIAVGDTVKAMWIERYKV